MNIWDEVDKISIGHSLTIEALIREDCEFNFEQEFRDAHYQRGQLLDILDQFRPRPFDPEDRGTWPENGRKGFGLE